MEKSLYSQENLIFRGLLKTLRKEAGLTQEELAKKLNWPQSYVSRFENGERRLDPVELYFVCRALGIPFLEFARRWEEAIEKNKGYKPLKF